MVFGSKCQWVHIIVQTFILDTILISHRMIYTSKYLINLRGLSVKNLLAFPSIFQLLHFDTIFFNSFPLLCCVKQPINYFFVTAVC